MTGVYLSLRVYFYQELQDNYGKYLPIYIKNKSNHIREFLKETNKLADDLLIEIDLDNEGTLARIHSLGTVVAKYYDADNIPSTEDLVNDVKYLLDIYNFILHYYTEKTDISVDEWIEVLSNKEVIDSKMYSILEIMNGFENKSALSSQIAEKRGQLGFDDEKSYNSTIVSNSRRVKEYLDKKAILGEDGKEIFWMRFFYGKKLKEGFEFSLREELIEALERVDRDIGSEGVGSMSEDESYDSFYAYLIDEGYYFDKETVENYLLSLKVKPFAILTGNSGTGKTKLSQLFAQYLNDSEQNSENKMNSISTNVLVGKSFKSGGWALNKKDLRALIPIDEFENSYSILVDGINAEGNLQVNPRLFYKGNELKQHLEKLAEEDERQKVPLKILLNENDKISSDKYTEVKMPIKEKSIKEDKLTFSKDILNEVLNLKHFEGKVDAYFDNIKSNVRLSIFCFAECYDEEIMDYLNSENLSEITIKIKNQDIYNTFNDYVDFNGEISFERDVGRNWEWILSEEDWSKFIPLKKIYDWDCYIDGKHTTAKFIIFDVRIGINNQEQELTNYLNQKNEDEKINIKLDLSTLQRKNESFNILANLNDCYEKENNLNNNSNYKIIPVGANWTENRNIVGYYNVITDEYQSTPAYDLIKYANKDRNNPYFLILDEMNLSHVERYFADFLSAIESGESIPLYGNDEDLGIPSNLFIIGTVNVDETTYMFSPKVLDRANTIEFDTYSAKNYMLGEFNSTPPSGDIEFLEDPLEGSEIREMDINQLKELFEDINTEFWNVLSDEIFKFQEILKKSNFDFGFRVINEIIRFMYVAWVYEGRPEEWTNWERYFDAQIKQKMLPKLHGSERAIGETLDGLYNACFLDDSSRAMGVETSFKYPKSAKKLDEMIKVLSKQRYVSFIN